MNYLVATDGSKEARNAIRYAVTQAGHSGASLEIVHVLEPEAVLRNGELILPGGDKSLELADRTLERAVDLTTEVASEQGMDIAVETTMLTGRPAHAIADHARETGVDAIYIGHQGLSEEHEKHLGSVAKALLGKVEIPVTVVR